MNEDMILNVGDIEELLKVMQRTGRSAIIDFVNRRLMVLSEEKPFFDKNGKQVILSTGPATAQDYLYNRELR